MNFLKRLGEAFEVLKHPKGGLSYLLKKEASIASFLISDKISGLIPDLQTVIDVGANQGQFARAVALFYPKAAIYSFEPVPETFERLAKNLAGEERFHLYNFGLGSAAGDITFYKNAHSHASSALEVSDYQKENIPLTREYSEIRVKVVRLDDFDLGLVPGGPVLLKLDVQGFEKEVLLGAPAFLTQVDYLLLETSFVSMYKNEPLFDEMNIFLRESGFSLMGPVGTLEVNGPLIPQMDMLYKKE